MKIKKTIRIERSPQDVWHLIAEEFDQAYVWMNFVTKSYPLNEIEQNPKFPVVGRVCEFSEDPNGLKAKEKILTYSEQDMRFSFNVIPINAPSFFPIKENLVTMSVVALSDQESQVSWESEIHLSPLGVALYPILKRGLSKNFSGVMKDLKKHLELTNHAVLSNSA